MLIPVFLPPIRRSRSKGYTKEDEEYYAYVDKMHRRVQLVLLICMIALGLLAMVAIAVVATAIYKGCV